MCVVKSYCDPSLLCASAPSQMPTGSRKLVGDADLGRNQSCGGITNRTVWGTEVWPAVSRGLPVVRTYMDKLKPRLILVLKLARRR